MSDLMSLSGRDSMPTVMQWEPASHAGVSPADPESFVHPLVPRGVGGRTTSSTSRATTQPTTSLTGLALNGYGYRWIRLRRGWVAEPRRTQNAWPRTSDTRRSRSSATRST